MVRNYIRKTDRANWSEEQMKLAILAFGVPKDSLNHRVKGEILSIDKFRMNECINRNILFSSKVKGQIMVTKNFIVSFERTLLQNFHIKQYLQYFDWKQ
jgi:hypothetical protein